MVGQRRPSGRSPIGTIRPAVRFERRRKFSDYSHQANCQWVHQVADSVGDTATSKPSRDAIDETTIKINSEWPQLYAATNLDTKLMLEMERFGHTGLIQRLHSFTDSVRKTISPTPCSLLISSVIGLHSLILAFPVGPTTQVEISLKSGFQTLKMRIDRFHNS